MTESLIGARGLSTKALTTSSSVKIRENRKGHGVRHAPFTAGRLYVPTVVGPQRLKAVEVWPLLWHG